MPLSFIFVQGWAYLNEVPLGTPLYGLALSAAYIYYTEVEMTDTDKHTSLLQYGIKYDRKKFTLQAMGWYLQFTKQL